MNGYLARVRHNRLFKSGALLFLVGVGPLLGVIVLASHGLTSDPNPNPGGFGILALFRFWPSVILMLLGLGTSARRSA